MVRRSDGRTGFSRNEPWPRFRLSVLEHIGIARPNYDPSFVSPYAIVEHTGEL